MTKKFSSLKARLHELAHHNVVDKSSDFSRGDTRSNTRKPVYRIGSIILPNGQSSKCTVVDLNGSGAKIMMDGAAGLPPIFKLIIEDTGGSKLVRLIWMSEREAGVAFEQQDDVE